MMNKAYTATILSGFILMGAMALSTSASAQSIPLVSILGDFDGDGDDDRAMRAVGSDTWFVTLGSQVGDDGMIRMDVRPLRDGRTDFRPGKGQFETFKNGYLVWGHATWNFVYATGLNGTYAVYEDGRVLKRSRYKSSKATQMERTALLEALDVTDEVARTGTRRGHLFRYFKRARLQASR